MPIKQQQPIITENFQTARQPAMSGLNTIKDQHDLTDQESPDLGNVWFDAGVTGPRTGSALFAAKPTGETGTPLQCFVAKASDGVNYLISVYVSGTTTNNFYVWHTKNSWWVPINGSYLPTFTQILRFGYTGWCGGFGNDRLYFCNGYDNFGRWRMNLNHLALEALSTDSTLTLNDASRFSIYTASISNTLVSGNTVTLNTSPQANALFTNEWELGQLVYYTGPTECGLTANTVYYAIPTQYVLPTNGFSGNSLGFATTLANAKAGTAVILTGTPSGTGSIYKAEPLIIQSAVGSTMSALYYNVSGNVLSLVSPLGTNIAVGASVTTTITERPFFQGGVPSAGGAIGNSLPVRGKIMTMWQARMAVASQSPGGETTLYLSRISEPEDWTTVADDITSGGNKIFQDGFGGITDLKDFGEFLVVQKQDIVYRFDFEENQDLSAQIPQTTPIISGLGMGAITNQSSVKALNSIYYPTTSSGFIQLSPLTSGVNTSTGLQVISFNINNYIQNNLSFTNTVGTFYRNKLLWTATSTNSSQIVIVYDTVRQAWTKFDSWNPTDMFVYNNLFYFMSSVDGGVYQGFTGYTDNNNQYMSYFYTKMNNYGQPALPKVADAYYVEGYMTQSTTLYTDVLYNEKGELFYETFKLAYNTPGFYFSNINITDLGQVPFNQSILDSLTPSQVKQLGFFRAYLSISNRKGFFALQAKFYSKDPNSVWFISGHGPNIEYQPALPPLIRIDPLSQSI